MKLLGILCLPFVLLIVGCTPKYPLTVTVEWMTDKDDNPRHGGIHGDYALGRG